MSSTPIGDPLWTLGPDLPTVSDVESFLRSIRGCGLGTIENLNIRAFSTGRERRVWALAKAVKFFAGQVAYATIAPDRI